MQLLNNKIVLFCSIIWFITNCCESSYHEQVCCGRNFNYKYQYAITDHKFGLNNYRSEDRQGDYVRGTYSLLDADGQIRTVHYEVDGHSGFKAFVTRNYPNSPKYHQLLNYNSKPYQYLKPVQKFAPVLIWTYLNQNDKRPNYSF